MRNKIIEEAIDRVIDESNTSSDFKSVFKKYINNNCCIAVLRNGGSARRY